MASGEFLWKQRMEIRADQLKQQQLAEEVPWHVDDVEVMEVVGDVINEFIFYFPRGNTYTDDLGKEISNIFDILTPNDILLFKERPYGNVFFLHKNDPNILIEMRHVGPSVEHNPELQKELKRLRAERAS